MDSTTIILFAILVAGIILCDWIADNFSISASIIIGIIIVVSALDYFDIVQPRITSSVQELVLR